MPTCTDCGADWSQGKWTKDCRQCGGAALELPCPRCAGQCGALWQRAVLDSQVFKCAHWFGNCKLPPEEQMAVLKKLYDAGKLKLD